MINNDGVGVPGRVRMPGNAIYYNSMKIKILENKEVLTLPEKAELKERKELMAEFVTAISPEAEKKAIERINEIVDDDLILEVDRHERSQWNVKQY